MHDHEEKDAHASDWNATTWHPKKGQPTHPSASDQETTDHADRLQKAQLKDSQR